MCGSKSCWSVTHHHQRDMPERRSSAPPPLNANVLRVRKFSYGFDLDSHINVTCACLNYAKACFGFCKKSRRYSEQVIFQKNFATHKINVVIVTFKVMWQKNHFYS